MTWAALLLADPSPCLRRLVLSDLLGRPDQDPEVQELAALHGDDPLVANLLALQDADGSWQEGDLAWSAWGGKTQMTALALGRLGYLGFGPEHPAVRRGAAYLFGRQQEDGSWPLGGAVDEEGERAVYSMVPLQTALPLRGLALCGYASDPRSERAYEWLLAQRLADGAWPTGIVAGTYRYVAGYRRLAHSRWGCRSNTTGALICLAHHPERCDSPEARRGLDLLLGRETHEQQPLGFEVARLMGLERARGLITHFARYDLALMLDLCWRLGASPDDARVAAIVAFVKGLQGQYGLWEYQPRPQASRWVTFDLLRSLARLDETAGWVSLEPRTPFQAYPRQRKRY